MYCYPNLLDKREILMKICYTHHTYLKPSHVSIHVLFSFEETLLMIKLFANWKASNKIRKNAILRPVLFSSLPTLYIYFFPQELLHLHMLVLKCKKYV